jgi:hypothetical protein
MTEKLIVRKIYEVEKIILFLTVKNAYCNQKLISNLLQLLIPEERCTHQSNQGVLSDGKKNSLKDRSFAKQLCGSTVFCKIRCLRRTSSSLNKKTNSLMKKLIKFNKKEIYLKHKKKSKKRFKKFVLKRRKKPNNPEVKLSVEKIQKEKSILRKTTENNRYNQSISDLLKLFVADEERIHQDIQGRLFGGEKNSLEDRNFAKQMCGSTVFLQN